MSLPVTTLPERTKRNRGNICKQDKYTDVLLETPSPEIPEQTNAESSLQPRTGWYDLIDLYTRAMRVREVNRSICCIIILCISFMIPEDHQLYNTILLMTVILRFIPIGLLFNCFLTGYALWIYIAKVPKNVKIPWIVLSQDGHF